MEPEDFKEPMPGDKVCCNVAGGRYGAAIIRCIHGKEGDKCTRMAMTPLYVHPFPVTLAVEYLFIRYPCFNGLITSVHVFMYPCCNIHVGWIPLAVHPLLPFPLLGYLG